MSNLAELLAELLSETDARDLVDRVGLDARYIEFRGHPVNVWNNVLRAARLKPGKLQAVVDSTIARYPDYTDELTKAHAAYLRSRPALEQADRNRIAMLEKIRTIWITGFLQKSLFQETRILLGLSERTDAVVRPMDLLVQRPDKTENPLSPGTEVVDVFDAMTQALLILGSPGSGKTTLLLEVARDLLDRATEHVTYPIPVVFSLSTWAESRRPIAEWLVDELNLQYDVPRKIGQAWVDTDQIAPLLDGLDEVKPEHRTACADAINAFRRDHGLLPLVVSSRTADYQALAVKLRLQGAVVVQPLTHSQVDSYLTKIGPAGVAVREAIRHDPTQWEMLDSPLMLNIVTVAYAGQPESQPRLSGTLEERRDHLFGAYVDQMFRRRGVDRRYTPQQIIHWLTWLAWQMARHSQTVFYIERLQPDWLPGEKRRAVRLVFGLVFGLVGLYVWLAVVSSVFELVFGPISGLVYGLVSGLVLGLVNDPSKEIKSVETVHWSWRIVSGLVFGLVLGLLSGLFFGLVGLGAGLFFGLVFGPVNDPSGEIKLVEAVHWSWRKVLKSEVLVFGLVFGLVVWLLGWLLFGLFIGTFILRGLLQKGLSVGEIETRDIPNQGIHRSAWNALVFGLVFGLVGGLLVGPVFGPDDGPLVSRLIGGLGAGLVGGLGAGLGAGGQACLGHLALRLLLVRSDSIPWNYVKFLDYAAERILLRKVGGGYIFIHRMLLEYFAARYDASSVEATSNAPAAGGHGVRPAQCDESLVEATSNAPAAGGHGVRPAQCDESLVEATSNAPAAGGHGVRPAQCDESLVEATSNANPPLRIGGTGGVPTSTHIRLIGGCMKAGAIVVFVLAGLNALFFILAFIGFIIDPDRPRGMTGILVVVLIFILIFVALLRLGSWLWTRSQRGRGRISGADLRKVRDLTQEQLESARGDKATRLP